MEKNCKSMNMFELMNQEEFLSQRLRYIEGLAEATGDKLTAVQNELNARNELNEKIRTINGLLGDVIDLLKERNGELIFINNATGEVLAELNSNQFHETDEPDENVSVDYRVR